MTKEPTKCTHCGSDEIAFGYSMPPVEWTVECYADGCERLLVADTQEAAFAGWAAGRWTHKVSGRDDYGNPLYETA
jgi:hypothetical protein